MAVLDTVGLAAMADKPAPLLSGGQQQRVALARALVSNPEVLLLDEPFSNLDARLRDDMRLQLRDVQRRLGVTSVFVTHDQTEAMMLSERVLVMNAGRVEQAGTPREVYESPRSQFVMDFLGQVSHLPAVVLGVADGQLDLRVPDAGDITLPQVDNGVHESERVVLAFRSADVEITRNVTNGAWPAVVESVVYLGGREEYVVRIGATEIRSGQAAAHLAVGATVGVHVPPRAIRVFTTEGAAHG
jgi:ABC-type Fe3+/spermidine/putrescine transport system ATPase subunit